MQTSRQIRQIVAIALALLLPNVTIGQQSILLEPSEQAPILIPTLPGGAQQAPSVPTKPSSQGSKKSINKSSIDPGATVNMKQQSANIVLNAIRVKETADGFTLHLVTNKSGFQHDVRQLQNPTRLVVDILGARPSKKLKRNIKSRLGTIRVGAHADKTRVVIDFGKNQIPSYQVQTNKGLNIAFASAAQPYKEAPSAALPPTAKDQPLSEAAVADAGANEEDVVIAKPVKKQDISKPTSMPSDQHITIDLRDADIRNVLRFIAQASGYNIVAGDDVTGTITIRLKNVPWREALQAILQVKGLGYTENDGIIRVLPLDALQKEQSARLVNTQLAESNLPLVTRLLPVNYAAAQTLIPQIKEMLSLRGKVSVDERTNVLIISDIADNVEKIDRLIQTLDTQTPQVLIEARMVEANTTFSRSLGVQWGGSIFGGAGANNPTGIVSTPTTAGTAGVLSAARNYAVNLPATAATSGIGFSLGTVGNLAVVNARLSAAENNGQAKTVSMPKIMTLDNKAARITQGFQIPYTIYNLQTVQTQFVNAALQLDVVPHVTSDGAVQMSVKISQNMPDFQNRDNLGIPAVRVKEATTELLVKDGDTAVIGGIYTRSIQNNSGQVPLLGSIPVLGWLFKNSHKSDEQTEMLVFLTPRLMNRKKSTIDTSLVDSRNPDDVRRYDVP